MPHQCTKCNISYPDDDEIIIAGCSCGAKSFLFLKNNVADDAVEDALLCELRNHCVSNGQAVTGADLACLRIAGEGKYDVNLQGLLQNKNREPQAVITLDEGKYHIDLDQVLQQKK